MSTGFSRCRAVAARLAEVRRVMVLSGAGVSVPSGIPDFRSATGLWERFPPEEYATIEVFRRDPEKFWTLNHELFRDMVRFRPNPAHEAIAELDGLGLEVTVVTQNIDGLHQAAGSRQVIELHGGKDHLVCLSCGLRVALIDQPLESGVLPRCRSCAAILKPDCVYFGEALPVDAFREAQQLARECGVCLVVGTSGQVYPAASLPGLAFRSGATVCEFNLEATDLTHSGVVEHFIEGSVDESLPALMRFLKELA